MHNQPAHNVDGFRCLSKSPFALNQKKSTVLVKRSETSNNTNLEHALQILYLLILGTNALLTTLGVKSPFPALQRRPGDKGEDKRWSLTLVG